jgi:hypothetical protein
VPENNQNSRVHSGSIKLLPIHLESSQVPTAPNLDILTETVTDTRAAPPSATAQMQRIFGELDKAAEEQNKIKPAVLRGLPKYKAIACHANGRFRKTLIPPRDKQGRIAEWWLQRDAPPLYKLQVRLGLINQVIRGFPV